MTLHLPPSIPAIEGRFCHAIGRGLSSRTLSAAPWPPSLLLVSFGVSLTPRTHRGLPSRRGPHPHLSSLPSAPPHPHRALQSRDDSHHRCRPDVRSRDWTPVALRRAASEVDNMTTMQSRPHPHRCCLRVQRRRRSHSREQRGWGETRHREQRAQHARYRCCAASSRRAMMHRLSSLLSVPAPSSAPHNVVVFVVERFGERCAQQCATLTQRAQQWKQQRQQQ